MADIKDKLIERYDVADDWLSIKRDYWTDYENAFHNKVSDLISDTTKSQVFDPKLSTYVLERSYRVMAQLMAGKVKAISKNDEGASKLMNLIIDKYVLPNANAQFDFLTKCRMINTYSNIYGNFFAFIDWDVKTNGYRGPDMWLIPIRDVFPQVGAISLEDSEYIIIRTLRPLSYFKTLAKRDSFKNLPKVIEKLSQIPGDKETRDTGEKSEREDDQYSQVSGIKGKGYYETLSMYERDRWVDYVVKADEVIRDIKSPHDDGELPIENKYSIPLFDDFMGMGDFERGLPMQNTLNSAWNLYLDAVKVSIFPPVLLNKDNVAVMSSIKFSPAAKWLVRNQIGNVAQTLQLNPQGISTFNNVYQVANASLMNMFGTSDTSVSEKVDPGLGKTPQALRMQQARENSRDVTDRYYMETFLTGVMKKFVNLLSKNQSKAIQIRMFEQEIDQLAATYPEIQEMYDNKTGKLTIEKGKTGSILYDYEIVSGSTYAVDQNRQQENLATFLQLLLRAPQLLQILQQEGKVVRFSELFTRMMTNSGIQDWDKIILDKRDAEAIASPEEIMNNADMQFQNMIQQYSGVNQIPPQPAQHGQV